MQLPLHSLRNTLTDWNNQLSGAPLERTIDVEYLAQGGSLNIDVKVTNTGGLAGDFVMLALASPPHAGVSLLQVRP